MKPLTVVCRMLCVIAVQAVLKAPEEVDFNLKEDAKPDLNCILFGAIGCNTTCQLIAKLITQQGTGTCNKSFTCSCQLSQPTSLEALWELKFVKNTETLPLLNRLKRNPLVRKKILAILTTPGLSGLELRSQLINLLPQEHQLKHLKPTEIPSFILENIKINNNLAQQDRHQLINYVKTETTKMPPESTYYLSKNDYKERMEKFTTTVKSEFTIKHVLKQLKMISDPLLAHIWANLKKTYELSTLYEDEKNEDSYKKVTDTITISVIQVLITQAEKRLSTAKIEKNLRIKYRKRVDNLQNDIPRWNPPAKKTKDNEDKNGKIRRDWRGENSYIRYIKDRYGNVDVNWLWNDTHIHLNLNARGDVNQEWIFGDVKISLRNDKEGNINHKWDFGYTQYFFNENYMGGFSFGWTKDPDFYALTIFRQYIKTWCNQNTELFPYQCVVDKL